MNISDMNDLSQKENPKRNYQIAIVVATFNQLVTESLLNASLETLLSNGIHKDSIKIYRVPGAYEIPLTCKKILERQEIDGIITLGAVIKGETPHFDFVAGECSSGVMKVSLEYSKPISFGVLTTNTVEQAMNRAGLKYGNKGTDAAMALLSQLNLFSQNGL